MKHPCKRLLCLLLSLVMVFSVAGQAFAVRGGEDAEPGVTWEKVSSGRASPNSAGVSKPAEQERDPQELVRVSIVLKGESTLERGYSTRGIGDNANAMNYRASLKQKQQKLAEKISSEILGGEPLDVVRNITLAANIISANVPYGCIEAIKALDEVKTVVLEARYEPDRTADEGEDPNMYRAVLQTGTDAVWAKGITGAGSRVAVIDTGIDTDHQSFAENGYLYSLQHHPGQG